MPDQPVAIPPATAPTPPNGAPAPTTTPPLTTEWVQAQIDDLAANTALDAQTRDQATAFYKTALTRIEAAKASEAAANSYKQAIESAPAELAALQQATASKPPVNGAVTPPDLSALSVDELEQQLTRKKLESSSARKTLADIEQELQSMTTRPAAARTEIQEENRQVADVDKSMATPAPSGEASVVTAARNISLRARKLASAKRIEALEQELVSLQPRQNLLTAKRDAAAADAARLDKEVEEVQRVVNSRRQQQAQAQQAEAERTRREVAAQYPVLANYAEENAALTEQWAALDRQIAKSTRTQAAIKSQQDQLAENAQSVKQLLDIGAVGEEYGLFLRELWAKLPNTARFDAEVDQRERVMIDARLQRLRIQERERNLVDVDAAVARILAANPSATTADGMTADQLKSTLADLIVTRKKTLAQLSSGYSQLIKLLTDINADARELADQNAALDVMLRERLLWLPSAAPIGAAWWKDVVTSVTWLTHTSSWSSVGRTLWVRVKAYPASWALVMLSVVVLVATRPRMRRYISELAGRLNRVSTDRFMHTVATLAITVLLTLPLPLLFGFVGGQLVSARDAPPMVAAIGSGLISAAMVLFILRSFFTMCRPKGLFIAHFQWGEAGCRRLGHELRWLMILESIAAFFVSACHASTETVYFNGLGRLAFMIGSAALAVFIYRVLHPKRGAAAGFIARSPGLMRFRYLWFPAAVMIPAGLGVLSAMGYFETAAQMQGRLFTSGWVGLVSLIVYSLAVRWLLVEQRRLAFRQAVERRDKARAAKAKEAADTGGGDTGVAPIEEPQVNISAVSLQTRTLLRWVVGLSFVMALWGVWSRMFPTIHVLDKITLWTHVVSGAAGEAVVPVTAWDIAMAVLVGIVTVVAAKNLPGLIEIAVLQRLSVPSGTRYAIATVTQYVIVFAGILTAFNLLGADWSKMQWIAAALGVGLGFGLQEIVANFVSGLIILFEQPVRVGDLVTVGDRIGTVSRIQIRATTITDFDNREVIIPNKAFITDRVINWALSDPVTRIVVPVGVSYGCDAATAHKVLLDTVRANPLVLETPAPVVVFTGFGDSALNFEVRAYVRDINNRVPLIHELHMAIHMALRKAGIEIPFPQRDIHVRSAGGLDAFLSASKREASPPSSSS